MPLYLDRHDGPGATAEETARNHLADLAIAPRFGVEFLSYWHDPASGVVTCFARAPGADAMVEAHRASHGDVPTQVIEVSESEVVRFLGKVHDPADATEVTSAFRVICFSDLVGSTALLDRLGQAEYMVLLTEHDLIVRKTLLEWRGREIKHTGDGFMVVFEDVDAALGWSLAVCEAIGKLTDLDVRIGIAAGEPVETDGDIFGAAVTLANRICATAGPQEVRVSGLVRDIGMESGFAFDRGRTETLKGFSKPATVFQLLGGRPTG